MYVCMYACMHACVCVCVHACVHVCACVRAHVCVRACVHAYVYVCMSDTVHVEPSMIVNYYRTGIYQNIGSTPPHEVSSKLNTYYVHYVLNDKKVLMNLGKRMCKMLYGEFCKYHKCRNVPILTYT